MWSREIVRAASLLVLSTEISLTPFLNHVSIDFKRAIFQRFHKHKGASFTLWFSCFYTESYLTHSCTIHQGHHSSMHSKRTFWFRRPVKHTTDWWVNLSDTIADNSLGIIAKQMHSHVAQFIMHKPNIYFILIFSNEEYFIEFFSQTKQIQSLRSKTKK